jgi:hypothetical protein
LKRLLALPALLLLCASAHGQVVAVDCTPTGVQNAFNAVVASTTTVTIPSCAGGVSWTNTIPVSLVIPSGNTALSIIGAGNLSVTGGGDQTVIIDNVNRSAGDPAMLSITLANSTTILRIAGITFTIGTTSSTKTFNGSVRISANGSLTQNIRIDHNHFNMGGSSVGALAVNVFNVTGVIDHNIFDMPAPSNFNGLRLGNDKWNGFQFGDGAWDDNTNFGTSKFLFFEDNVANNGFMNDCNNGGRMVLRHNTLNSDSLQGHEMEDRNQGCRAYEVYSNTWTTSRPNQGDTTDANFFRTGTGLFYNNSATNFPVFFLFHNDRSDSGHAFGTSNSSCTSNCWGYAGTQVTGTGSGLDQAPTTTTGYPTTQQIGRGKAALLPQHYWPFSTTEFTWYGYALDPAYIFNNTFTGGSSLISVFSGSPITSLRDYYVDDGTNGVRVGTSLPGTCTPLMGFWNTSTNTLYQCQTTNVWTQYYQPFTYPYPGVAGGAPVLAFSPNPAAFGNQNINTTSTPINITVSNIGSATETYSSITLSPSVFVNGNTGLVGQCPASGTIAASASCVVRTTFTPTAVQNYSGTISVTGTVNGSGNITGAGTNAVSIPSVPSGLTATAAGSTVNLSWTASTGTPTGYLVFRATVSGGPYTQIANVATTSYADTGRPNGTFFYVVQAYNSAGNSANSSQASATISTACNININPPFVQFGTITQGSTATTQFVNVSNVGTATCTSLVVNDPSGPSSADFSQTNTCSSSLAIGTTCVISVGFTPSTTTSESASIVVTSSDPASPDTASLAGTGVAGVIINPVSLAMGNVYTTKTSATQTINYTNQSGATITISSIAFSGGDSAQFGTSNDCAGSVLNGVTCHINVTFTPTSNGNKSTTLVITDSASGSPRNITVTGSAKGHHILKVGVAI